MKERYKDVVLLFYDEARFGRISEIAHCWCFDGHRPTIPSLKIRKYLNVFGAVSPIQGESWCESGMCVCINEGTKKKPL